MLAAPQYLISAIGNRGRGDDGAGPLTADLLQARVTPDVALTVCDGDLVALLEDWVGYEAVFCIDAAAPGQNPGRVYRFDDVSRLPHVPIRPSSHAFGLAETIALGAMLGRLPEILVIYAIEGAVFSPGAAMTSSVTAACTEVAEMVLQELEILRSGEPAARRPDPDPCSAGGGAVRYLDRRQGDARQRALPRCCSG